MLITYKINLDGFVKSKEKIAFLNLSIVDFYQNYFDLALFTITMEIFIDQAKKKLSEV